jgi:hypothetical protein
MGGVYQTAFTIELECHQIFLQNRNRVKPLNALK